MLENLFQTGRPAVGPDRLIPAASRRSTIYADRGELDGWKNWRTDFPRTDRQFLTVLRRLVRMDACPEDHVVAFDDPALRRFPFLYAAEVGQRDLTEAESSPRTTTRSPAAS